MLYYYIVLYYNNLNIQQMKNIKKLPFILSILSFITIFVPVNAEIKVTIEAFCTNESVLIGAHSHHEIACTNEGMRTKQIFWVSFETAHK